MFQFNTRGAIFALCLATAAAGYAKKGDDHDKGGDHGKPKDKGTTFVVGTVTCTDNHILDVSGNYTLTGTSHTVTLSITQDARGRLSTTATVTLADGSTTQVTLTGHLQLSDHNSLRIQLDGGGAAKSGDDNDDNDDNADNDHERGSRHGGESHKDKTTSSVSVSISGPWNGTSFQVTVKITDPAGNETFNSTITSQKPARGFTIADAVSTLQSNGKSYRSTRTVTLPWGTVTGVAKQDNNDKKGVSFSMHSGNFGLDLSGNVSGNTFTTTKVQVHTGYGELKSNPSSTTVAPSALTH